MDSKIPHTLPPSFLTSPLWSLYPSTHPTQRVNERMSAQLAAMMARLETRFLVSLDDVRAFDAARAALLVHDPISQLPLLETVVREQVLERDTDYFAKVARQRRAFVTTDAAGERAQRVFVGVEGHFGARQVTPRSLLAEHLSSLVCLEGIATKCSVVRPKVVRSVHYCPATRAFDTREFRDATDLSGAPTGVTYPTKDANDNPLETEFGLCLYKDSQTFSVQEMPEAAPLGQLPRSVDVFVEADLVDAVKPGDRVAVVGIYRALSGASATCATSGVFKTVLLANNIRRLGRDTASVKLSPQDVANIKAIATDQSKSSFDRVARSLAPSIYGHKYVKQALALLLLGGLEHNLANGTHIRGDINILMVGDPSTAKSQLLRFVLNIAPVAVNTTGRGSSGVGLTAAVTTDPETGERRLEAGAMVLADRGVVSGGGLRDS